MNTFTTDGHTRLAALLGSPVSHSVSPLMHNEAFRLLGLNCIYMCFDVTPDKLKQVTDAMRTMNVLGFNLTMPDKIPMYSLCDEVSDAARLTGAVNTVVNENGKLIGHNTDGTGYVMAMRDAGFDITGKKMILLGAGGAASSIAVQCALDGAETLDIYNRPGKNYDKISEISEKLNRETGCRVEVHDINDRETLYKNIKNADLLTNATPVGMAPDEDRCILDDSAPLDSHIFVSDIIYNPRETLLMKMSRKHGCRTANGMYMLLYQGAEAFRLWTGQDMPVDAVKKKYFS